MSRVFDDIIQHGKVAKIADDLFCGGATPGEALETWRLVLQALDRCVFFLFQRRSSALAPSPFSAGSSPAVSFLLVRTVCRH